MNNKQKMYLGVFILAVIVLGIMYSMGTFSKSSLMSFSDTGAVAMTQNIMSENKGFIDSNTTNIGTNATDISTNRNTIGTTATSGLRGKIKTNTTSIGTNATDIGNRATMDQLDSAIDGATDLAAADRAAIKNFVRSKAVLFNPANYNKQGQDTIGALIGKDIITPVSGNDEVF